MKPVNEELIHILDESACLTRRQMKDYLAGKMLPEEIHAAETHLNACPLCSLAMEGFEAHTEEALEAIAELNSGFLKEHFDSISPQIHLNSMAPAAALSAPNTGISRQKSATRPFWRISSVAAALLVGFGLTWYFTHERNERSINNELAMRATSEINNTPAAVAPAPDAAPAGNAGVANRSTFAAAAPAHNKAPDTDALLAAAEKKVAGEMTTPRATLKDAPARSVAAPSTLAAPPPPAVAAAPPALSDKPVTEAPKTAEAFKAKSIAHVDMAAPAKPRNPEAAPSAAASGSAARDEDRSRKEEPAGMVSYDDESAKSAMDQGEELYAKKKWTAALARYKAAMNTGSKSHRHQATIMAARCYLNLGKKEKAAELLQGIVEEGGAKKHAAKKMLRDLPGE